MTQQVRNGYRKHRKTTWGLALLMAIAIGAMASPLASGGGGKTYTLTVSPTSFCSGAGNSSTVTLTNNARTQTLGSAELFFPPGSLSSASMNGTSVGYSTGDGSPYLSGTYDIIGPLNNLNLSYGQPAQLQVTYSSSYTGSGKIQAVVKHANNFNDTSGGANTFDNPPWPTLSIAACHYVFTQPPNDAQTGTAQTVKVQLQSGSTAVAVSGALTLAAVQDGRAGTPGVTGTSVSSFTGLTSSGQDSTHTWVFNSVTGSQSGTYELVAGSGTATQTVSNSFDIVDCMPSGSGGTCSTPQVLNDSGGTGYQVSGTGLSSGFDVNFSGDPDSNSFGYKFCQTEGWSPMTYPLPDGKDGYFEQLTTTTTSYLSSGGYQLVTLYFANALYVQTAASQTNNIQICAGFQHTNSSSTGAWTDASGSPASLDSSGFYWGVLQRIPNCNKNKWPYNSDTGIYSPALCGWGTVTIGGIDYRSATVIVPSDWDGHFGY